MFNFKRKLILNFSVIIIFLLIFSLSLTSCDIIAKFLQKKILETESVAASSEIDNEGKDKDVDMLPADSSKDNSADVIDVAPEVGKPANDINGFKVAYFDVGSSLESDHFEHRVANVFVVNPDGSDKKLIYSDIDEKYDLGFIYSTSPDGKKVLGMLTEGGRGLYSALCVVNIENGSLKKLVEFDYTRDEAGVELGIYGTPVWSNDSLKVAYELISNPETDPFSGNFRDAGIFIVNVDTAESYEVEIEAAGASARSTLFLNPVAFSPDDETVFIVSHPYYEKIEEGEVMGYYTQNDTLYSVGVGGGNPARILGVEDFGGIGPEIITSFDNFKIIRNESKLLFQVLGDFEEDGDLWVCSFDGSGLEKITEDEQLREQQPCVYEAGDSTGKVAYIGALRYGTIGYQLPSGGVFIASVDGTGTEKLTDYELGASNPIFSTDGKFLTFLFSNFDENLTYVTDNVVRVYDFSNGNISEVKAEGYIFDIAGWVIAD